jgi:hypothetical protein
MQPRGGLRAHAAAAKLRTDVTGAGFVLTKTLRGEVRRRVLLTMSRFGPGIQGVAVRLAESQNPLGGVDRRCRVRARLRSGLLLQAEAVNGELEEAVGRSTARLARLVAIALDGADGRVGQVSTALPPRSHK